MLNPVEFAYEFWGKRVCPGSPMGWTKAYGVGSAGGKTRPAFGMTIFISESRIKTFRISYPDVGVVDDGTSWPEFKESLMFNPPSEPWMAVGFSVAAVGQEEIVLNTTTSESVIVEKSGDLITRTRPNVLRKIFEFSGGDAKLLEMARACVCGGRLPPDEAKKIDGAFEKIGVETKTRLFEAARLAMAHEVPPGMVRKYIEWRKS